MAEIPPTSVYEQVLDKYDWAAKHIQKFNVAHLEFRNAHPIDVSLHTDTETGEVAYYVGQVPAIPSHLPLIVGDVLHSLRGSLDYLACGLAEVVTARTQFPIAKSAKTYQTICDRVVPGIRKEAREVLDGFHPYQGGDLFLWQLHRLNIIDKHRLILAVSMISPAQSFAEDQKTPLEGGRPEISRFQLAADMLNSFKSSEFPPVALHADQKLLTIPAAEADQKVSFYFAVSINELGIASGIPANLLLGFLYRRVGEIIIKLSPFLLR